MKPNIRLASSNNYSMNSSSFSILVNFSMICSTSSILQERLELLSKKIEKWNYEISSIDKEIQKLTALSYEYDNEMSLFRIYQCLSDEYSAALAEDLEFQTFFNQKKKIEACLRQEERDELISEVLIPKGISYSEHCKNMEKAYHYNLLFLEDLKEKVNQFSNDFSVQTFDIEKIIQKKKTLQESLRSVVRKKKYREKRIYQLTNEFSKLYEEYQNLFSAFGYSDEDTFFSNTIFDKINIF